MANDSGRSDEAEKSERSRLSDELEVPRSPPDPAATPHVLPDDELCYPDFAFDEGAIRDDGGFDLERGLTRESMRHWLDELAGGLASHDVGVVTPGGRAILGVGASSVSMSFDPDERHRGTLRVTFELPAKLMTASTDPDVTVAGSRGGRGFIPVEMLTGDAERFRCYSWIDDPLD